MISNKVLKTLEYNRILEQLATKTVGARATELTLQSVPANNYSYATQLLSETKEAFRIMFTHGIYPSFAVDDINFILDGAEKMSTLSMAELLKIYRVLRVSRNVRTSINDINDIEVTILKEYANQIFIEQKLEKSIDESILSETEMADNASVALRNIRRSITKQNELVRKKLNNYITSAKYKNILQDSIITVRGDRFVLPVKSEFRSSINGLIHDQSASGSTVFIEPLDIVQLNNDIKTLKIEEEQEIDRVLQHFTMIISGEVPKIRINFDMITALDMIFARAEYAKEIRATEPILNNNYITDIIRGRHPIINKDKVVPISIYLGDTFDMLLVTGPNTGGKTVTLKLIGLLTLMAMTGMYIPAEEESKIAFYSTVYSDIGDEQSIEQSLSTFSSHMVNIINIVDNLDEDTLVLLDELGAGTDPAEGAALAVSISKYILESGARSVMTTHYNELKEFSLSTPRVENASMDFDPETFAPTYNLIIGVPGSSNALQIAKRLGLNANIVEYANSQISEEKIAFEKIIVSAEIARKQAEIYKEESFLARQEQSKLLQEIKKERANIEEKQEKLNNIIRKQSKELIEDSVIEATDIIERLKELLDMPTEQNLFEARKMRKSLERMAVDYVEEEVEIYKIDKSQVKLGDTVLITSINKEGIVETNPTVRGVAKVRVGNIVLNLSAKDYYKIVPKKINKKQEKYKHNVTVTTQFAVKAVVTELKIIGKTISESIYLVDEFIDQAVLSGLNEVRLVHGKGTGVLREGMHKYLRKHSNVESFRLGKFGEGETGVTIITLK